MTNLKISAIEHNFSDPGTDHNRFNRTIFDTFIIGDGITETRFEEDGYVRFSSWLSRDRYFFDFNMDLTQWLQLDTSQDASYYGNWINPILRATLCYCEGDIYIKVANTDEDFLKLILEYRKWQMENDYGFSLDPGLNPNKEVIKFLKKYKESIDE